MAIPTSENLRMRDFSLNASELTLLSELFERLPDPDQVGVASVVEVAGDGYTLGWAFVNDADGWAFVPFSGHEGDHSSFE